MTLRKNFTTGQYSPISGRSSDPNAKSLAFTNYQSNLSEVYLGHPNRISRYNQYELMDTDAEVNACLDIIAEFSTQIDDSTGTPFSINYKQEPTEHEVQIITKQLQHWASINKFNQRMFKIFRNTLKYGDQIFLRDPETFELYWVDPVKLKKIIVNETQGKIPEQYIIEDISPNFQSLVAAQRPNQDVTPGTSPTTMQQQYQFGTSGASDMSGSGRRYTLGTAEGCMPADHILHISLSEGLDKFYPFGQSILESIFKVFKQKELLEDAILIYRIQRAPERRVFKVFTGNMPANLAMSYVERIKNEVHQKRIPTANGGSGSVDATYNPLCLDLSTRIPLLDGRTLELSELIKEFNAGKENWAYSCDPTTGKIVPGLINWAGVTRKNTETIKLTFDNGKTLICTPDHKIPVFGKGFVEAQHLTPEDSLIAFNTREHTISGSNTSKYQQVWDHEAKAWVFTHRMVGNFFKSKEKHQEFCYLPENANALRNTIHHKDFDRYNNDPRNLVFMNKEDHVLFHSARKAAFWEDLSDEDREAMCNKISETTRSNWKNMTEDERSIAVWRIKEAQKKAVWMRTNDPETAKKYAENMRAARKQYFERNPLALVQVRENMEKRVKIKNQPLVFTFEMLQSVASKVKSGIRTRLGVAAACDSDQHLLNIVKTANSTPLDYKNAQCKIDFDKFGVSKLDRLIAHFGYKNWKQFVKEIANFNHRIVSIEKVENRDTGTITIDGLERWHDYHTFAIDSGIFIKNSINEDYFFPVGPDGHGSSVEMLPGGQNLGEIDDLRYFNNRLARGLRVPSSYLPTGPEESQTTVNDGRVGTAMIQEMRFNNYCKRLQRYVVERFDHEFKMFLSWRGLNIDSSLFDLTLTEPQNFTTYRQTELYNARLPIFQAMVQLPYISKRFALEEFLGMTKEQIQRNSVQWEEEQEQEPVKSTPGDLRSVGVSTSDIGADAEMADTEMSDLPDDLAADDMGDTGATAESPDATPELGGGEENATT